VVGTVFVALGILLVSAGGLRIVAQENLANGINLGVGGGFGLPNTNDVFFDLIFLLIPVVLVFVVLFKSSQYDHILKVIGLVFAATVVYGLFYLSILASVYNANSSWVTICTPVNGQIAVSTQANCDGAKVILAGLWITFIGELLVLIVLGILLSEIGTKSTRETTEV